MLTESEIQELETLLKVREIDVSRKRLKTIDQDSNKNYEFLFKAINEQKYNERGELTSGYRGCALEGSSRSGKTWSGVDIIIWLALYYEKNGCTINIYRQTYNEFKTTLYDDFKRRLDSFGLPNPFHAAKEIKSFKISKTTIYFLGDGKHGGGCDYAFFNEMMFIEQHVFDQTEMRCRKFWWADYNPSVTDHWFFDKVLPRQDVGFIRTTYKDNLQHISFGELNKIKGYEPWESDTYVVKDGDIFYNGSIVTETNQPPPNIDNINAGTADEFLWKVYGLGLRGAMKGVIFKHVEWVDSFPDMGYAYGMDFGFTVDPTTIVKHAEDDHNIWLELLCYQPIETPKEISDYMEAIGIEKELPITADSSDKHVSENKGSIEMVKGLRKLGWKVSKVSKTKGVMYWVNSMKRKKIHIVKNQFYQQAKKEKENYRMKEINGIAINQPIDDHNHFWDGGRYGHMAWNGSSQIFTTESAVINQIPY